MGNRFTPERGEVYEYRNIRMEVLRVDKDLRYAVVSCTEGNGAAPLEKNEPLPFLIGTRKVQT